ncbi:unnamed protein product [Trichobilharzia regenti]|nr:unnamed protein product [Trichobilharzia regenti]
MESDKEEKSFEEEDKNTNMNDGLFSEEPIEPRNSDRVDFGTNFQDTEHHESSNFLTLGTTMEESEDDVRYNGNTNNVKEASNSTKDPYIHHNVKYDLPVFYSEPKDSVSVHIDSAYGILTEIFFVPEKYTVSDVIILLVSDTGLKQENFTLKYKGELVSFDTPLITLAEENKLVNFSLLLRNAEDSLKIKLGSRELIYTSGLVVKIYGRKTTVTEDPYSQQSIMLVQKGGGTHKDQEYIHINWLPHNHHKPFLGGYRNILTDYKYHNASTQTKPLPRKIKETVHTSRDTQTYKMRHFGNMTVNHMSTQFSMPGFFVSNSQDRVKTPGPYESADEYLARVLQKIIIIQKYIRRWLAKKRVARLKKMRDDYLAWEQAKAQEYKDEIARRMAHDFERRLHPKTAADFDRLYNALEAWRREEVQKIEEQNLTQAEKKAALALILNEEAELITAITRHQICITKKNAEKIRSHCLKKAAAPHRWTSAIDGRMIEVATAETNRAKELLDIYESLSLEGLTQNERLDILLTLKQTVTPYNMKLSREIVGLVDREAELIMRGVPCEQLSGLRQRIRNRFIQFAKLPQVNPEVGKYLAVPTNTQEGDVPSLVQDIQYCVSCGRYLKKKFFPLSARANSLVPCESCRRNDNRGRNRLDLEPYQYILLELRENESRLVEKMKKIAKDNAREAELQRLERGESPQPDTDIIINGDDDGGVSINPLPFLINKEDIRFIIDQIWENRSVLSGWTDLFDLTLTRWKINEPWSPWNTIVVTREEAEIHANLGKLKVEDIYADPLINLVNQRLIMGKNEFLRLYSNGNKMAEEILIHTKRMQNPENTSQWLKEKRQKLPPLMNIPQSQIIKSHAPTYQPPNTLLPVIKGERRWSSLTKDNSCTT